MQIWNSLNEIPKDYGRTAVTIGKYDAIHLGHQFLFNRLTESAKQKSQKTVVVTFNQHPFEVLQPGSAPRPIIGPKQKIHLIEECGIDAVLNLEFTPELAAMSPQQFVQHILVDVLNAAVVMVGEGFRFGAGASGDCETLGHLALEHGFEFHAVERYVLDGAVVSTSAVRAALDSGDIDLAAKLLGRPHLTVGTVEHGLKIGRQIGFPTANISRDAEGYLPRDAVYAGWMYVDGLKLPTAISIGINETFQAVPRLAEAFVIDGKGLDLYGKEVTLEYVRFIRPAAKFDGVESLVAEINRDIEKIRAVLAI